VVWQWPLLFGLNSRFCPRRRSSEASSSWGVTLALVRRTTAPAYSIDAICIGSVFSSDSTLPSVMPTKNIAASNTTITPLFYFARAKPSHLLGSRMPELHDIPNFAGSRDLSRASFLFAFGNREHSDQQRIGCLGRGAVFLCAPTAHQTNGYIRERCGLRWPSLAASHRPSPWRCAS
jgi:hypothetical protein